MERKLVYNAIRTPDGTVLVSRHVHDYVTHLDKNGLEYMVDGGNEYRRTNVHATAPHEDLSLYSDSPYEEIRKVICRGGRGKDNKQPLTWVPLCEMSNSWLEAVIIYNQERGGDNKWYETELSYRTENDIFIGE